ncbi:hypothetical protein [Polyangium jinanense]|uniref:Uncharacterized protein n=1 Tax=Polyangium jinanense TaxID=2829994 RepID=A0A9X4AYW5_9BACT|nr:hypothetical protein [Polyangium jinanense]MDC3961331.1 hypothetical protein [Polyangium jinanense]MDC3987710.1 hypothetical protein [Polyangium jinanense]
MADDVSAEGKYLLISVPDFAVDTVGLKPGPLVLADKEDPNSRKIPTGDRKDETMSSFLRLGAFHQSPENDPAAKRALALAKVALEVTMVQGGPAPEEDEFGAEVNTDNTGVGSIPLRGEDGKILTDKDGKVLTEPDRGVFLDDQRIGDPRSSSTDLEGQSRPRSERMEHSAALLTRGGWWDHTDGNRISTTYGDKVEVIRGNYKMVVMSRQDNPEGAGGWDLSGGHVQDLGPASMPGASVRVEFRPGMFGQRGTWHLENTTNNFCQTSDYAGDFYEHWYGNHKESVIGSESPVEWHEELEKPYGNPAIVERTWASKIESYTGSSTVRIPSIHEETYADTTSSTTDVKLSISETTYCDGTITSKTGRVDRPVPAMHEETYAVASNSLTTLVTSNALTNVGVQMETTIAGTLGSLTLAAAQGDVELIAVKGSVSVAALVGEVEVVAKKRIVTVGNSFEWKFGTHEDTDSMKKKVKLKELDTTLDRLHTTLINKRMSMDEKLTALAIHLQGMQVAIGM